ncbi:MAG TPA: hypothetical protein VEY11_09265 [Pyrinomonadaceae bacterium]|nr:hypothetical protein [Pyrinomonadaceae bacterium]
MKNVSLILCAVLLGAVAAAAQTEPPVSAPPDIVVLQKNWRMVVRNAALDEDPFSANAEFNEALRAQRENDRQNAIRARGSESRVPPPPRNKRTLDVPSSQMPTYLYQVRLRNTGTKAIRAIDWGYIFTDPETQMEVGRHRYSNKVKIRPEKNSDLIGRTSSHPTFLVNVKNTGKEPGKQPTEQVVIYRVEYDDGTVWQNPSK